MSEKKKKNRRGKKSRRARKKSSSLHHRRAHCSSSRWPGRPSVCNIGYNNNAPVHRRTEKSESTSTKSSFAGLAKSCDEK